MDLLVATELRIGSRTIGYEHPPLVIAEIGINHEGDVNKALQCVDAAADAGAECIKIQTHITEAEMVPTDMTPGEISAEPLWDIIKRCELSADEERRVKEHAQLRGLLFLSTPFSREAADRLVHLGVPAFKIGSGECNNLPLLEHIAGLGRPVILSTGMNDLASVAASVRVFEEAACPLALMHCTSLYPTPYDRLRLGAIEELCERFQVPVGLSDHTLGIYTAVAAVALGACILEKHFTVTRSWPGPDVPMSIEPGELEELVKGVDAVFRARGGHKTVLPEEQPVIDFAFASVVTIRPIAEGEVFTTSNTWAKRPGTGPIHARDLKKILGRRARRSLDADIQLGPGDVGE